MENWIFGTLIMKNMPLVSIIIPVYNVEKYLREAVDSIINQTYRNLEIFLVDDGSKDGCGAICDEYSKIDERITVIHKENGGLSSARNIAMDKMHGEYVFFHDSDDVVANDIIEAYVKLCEENFADVVMGTIYEFIGDLKRYPETTVREITCYSRLEALKMMFMDEKLHHCAAGPLFRSSLWKNMRFPVGMLYEDHATVFYVVSNANKIMFCDDLRNYYRIREDSITNALVGKKDMELLDINDEVALNLSNKYPELKPFIMRMTMMIYLKLYSRILYVGWNAFNEEQRRIRKKIAEDGNEFIRSGLAKKHDVVKVVAAKCGRLPFYILYRASDFVQKIKNKK